MADRYAKSSGPGDQRPTALRVIQDEELEGRLKNKVVLITGCSAGLGVETAPAMFATGATLYLTARNLSKTLNILISNAGIMATSEATTVDGCRVVVPDQPSLALPSLLPPQAYPPRVGNS